MTSEQIIKGCESGKWTPEHVILRLNMGIVPLIKHFDLDHRLPTTELRYQICDCINALIEDAHNARGEHTEATTTIEP